MTCYKITVVIFTSLLLMFGISLSDNCIRRKYNGDSVVCVCNSEKCDNDPIPNMPEPGEYLQIVSNRDGLRFDIAINNFTASFDSNSTAATLTINRDLKDQFISGYGAALTDSAAINILSLSEATQQQLLRSYFTAAGLNIRYVRVPIALTDFSTHKYYYDEIDGDVNLVNFDLTKEDYDYKIPLIKRFIQMSSKKLRFIAAAWSPPEWMKNYPQNELSTLNEIYYQTWATYHLKFLQAYSMEEIEFFAISTGNEPMTTQLYPFNPPVMMPWEPNLQAKWLAENLGPTLLKNGYSDVKILIIDDSKYALSNYIETFLQNREAAKYIYGIGIHWYFDDLFLSDPLNSLREKYLNYPIINTEASWGTLLKEHVSLGNWSRAEAYVEDIIVDMNSGVSGWLEWNMALDLMGGPTFVRNYLDGLIIVNSTSDEFYKQPIFYALGHFSRFIPEQSIKISCTMNSQWYNDDLFALAIGRPDDYTTLVILNRFGDWSYADCIAEKILQYYNLLDYGTGNLKISLYLHKQHS